MVGVAVYVFYQIASAIWEGVSYKSEFTKRVEEAGKKGVEDYWKNEKVNRANKERVSATVSDSEQGEL
jgi:hypothetical protein